MSYSNILCTVWTKEASFGFVVEPQYIWGCILSKEEDLAYFHTQKNTLWFESKKDIMCNGDEESRHTVPVNQLAN